MSKEEILKKAIEKAEKNGFELKKEKHFINVGRDNFGNIISIYGYETIIFSHDFAKALWGEELKCLNCRRSLGTWENQFDCGCGNREIESWQYHLQQMVLEEDPIKYLEKFI